MSRFVVGWLVIPELRRIAFKLAVSQGTAVWTAGVPTV